MTPPSHPAHLPGGRGCQCPLLRQPPRVFRPQLRAGSRIRIAPALKSQKTSVSDNLLLGYPRE
jgi:hypothetical protein